MTCTDCHRTHPPYRRGLCTACYERHRTAGTLDTFPAIRQHAAAYVAEEWAYLATWGLSRAEVAARLGMSKPAFEKALARHATTTARRSAAS